MFNYREVSKCRLPSSLVHAIISFIHSYEHRTNPHALHRRAHTYLKLKRMTFWIDDYVVYVHTYSVYLTSSQSMAIIKSVRQNESMLFVCLFQNNNNNEKKKSRVWYIIQRMCVFFGASNTLNPTNYSRYIFWFLHSRYSFLFFCCAASFFSLSPLRNLI